MRRISRFEPETSKSLRRSWFVAFFHSPFRSCSIDRSALRPPSCAVAAGA